MNGLREEVEAALAGAERIRDDAADTWEHDHYSGQATAFREVLALLDQQPPKRWSAEVEPWRPAVRMTDTSSGFVCTVQVRVGSAESLAAQINGEA